jgi:hypothetical protein
VRDNVARVLKQFTPASWTRYDWRVFGDLKRFLYVLAMALAIMVVELDAFFLKFIFRLQPASLLNLYRLLLWWAVGMVGLRDYYAFMTDDSIKRLGATCWVCLAMAILELLVVLKFGMQLPEWRHARPPRAVVVVWTTAGAAALIACVWWFAYALPRRREQRVAAAAAAAAAAEAAAGQAAARVAAAGVAAAGVAAAGVAAAGVAAAGAAAAAEAAESAMAPHEEAPRRAAASGGGRRATARKAAQPAPPKRERARSPSALRRRAANQ